MAHDDAARAETDTTHRESIMQMRGRGKGTNKQLLTAKVNITQKPENTSESGKRSANART